MMISALVNYPWIIPTYIMFALFGLSIVKECVAINLAGLALIIFGIMGLLVYWLSWLKSRDPA